MDELDAKYGEFIRDYTNYRFFVQNEPSLWYVTPSQEWLAKEQMYLDLSQEEKATRADEIKEFLTSQS